MFHYDIYILYHCPVTEVLMEKIPECASRLNGRVSRVVRIRVARWVSNIHP